MTVAIGSVEDDIVVDSGLDRYQKHGEREEHDVVAEHGWMLVVAGVYWHVMYVCGYLKKGEREARKE